jgi:hypothetical protein
MSFSFDLKLFTKINVGEQGVIQESKERPCGSFLMMSFTAKSTHRAVFHGVTEGVQRLKTKQRWPPAEHRGVQ